MMESIEFSCGECGQTFETSMGLQNHVDTEHEDLVVLNDRDQSDPNLINENIEQLSNQGNISVTYDLRQKHLHSSSPKSDKASLEVGAVPYCIICDKSFSSHHGHLIHNGRYHRELLGTNEKHNDENRSNEENIEDIAASDSNVFYCKVCDKSFGNNHGLLIHNGRYHKNPEDVQQIDKKDNIVAVLQPSESEEGKANRTFSCESCGKSYNTYHALLIHNGRYHKDITTSTRRRRLTCQPNLMNIEKIDYKESGLFSCEDCSTAFNTFSEFLAHANRYHSEPLTYDEDQGKSIRGSITKTPAKGKLAAASEERVKRKSVQISDGKQLVKEGEDAQPATSREKRKRESQDETPTVDDRAKRRRVSRRSYADYDYDNHVRHACNECGKSYPTHHGLVIHQGRNHKRSTQSVDRERENLESHSPTDEDPHTEDSDLFVCNDCNKTFDTYHGFLIHAGRFHKSAESANPEERTSDSKVQIENCSDAVEIDISTYSCDGCDKTFHTERGLQIHTGHAHRRSTSSRERLKKSTKKAAQVSCLTNVIDVDIESPHGSSQIADSMSCAASLPNNEIPGVCERNPTDANPVENNEISEIKEQPVDPPNDAPPTESNETSEVNEQTVDIPNDVSPVENCDLPQKNQQRSSEGKTKNRPKPFSCDTCGQRFSCLSHRREHIDAVHKKLRQYGCPICGRRFLYIYDVPWHINLIHKKIKPYKCDICGSLFAYFTQRTSHIDIVHKKLKQYICSGCRQSFNCRADLRKHGKENHLGPFPCLECGKVYKCRRSFDLHFNAVHKGLRPHICEICEKTYPDKTTLSVKKYTCETCGKGFRTDSLYRLHVNVIHRGIKPFKCEFCRKSFATLAKYRRHVSAIHHQDSESSLTIKSNRASSIDPPRLIEVMDLTADDGPRLSQPNQCN